MGKLINIEGLKVLIIFKMLNIIFFYNNPKVFGGKGLEWDCEVEWTFYAMFIGTTTLHFEKVY